MTRRNLVSLLGKVLCAVAVPLAPLAPNVSGKVWRHGRRLQRFWTGEIGGFYNCRVVQEYGTAIPWTPPVMDLAALPLSPDVEAALRQDYDLAFIDWSASNLKERD